MRVAERDYRDWLIGLVNNRKEDYTLLLRELYNIEFYALVNYDEDRGADGLMLREEWADACKYRGSLDFGVANMLELLIGVSRRIEFKLFGSKYYDEWDYVNIFWDLINNLGLSDVFGDVSRDVFDEIRQNVSHFLNRDVFCHKTCNIFTFADPPKNLRKLNIWSQMALYVREKWPRD